jgi:hypothetical protein
LELIDNLENKEEKEAKLVVKMAMNSSDIKLLVKNKVKTDNIVKEISERYDVEVDVKKKVQNAINYQKKNSDLDFVIDNVTDFQNYVQEITFPFEDIEKPNFDDTQVFAADSYFSLDSREDQCFYVCLTTKSLLNNYVRQGLQHDSLIMMDGTYKLNRNMLPLLVAETYSKSKSFHLVAICISTNETGEAYTFFIE